VLQIKSTTLAGAAMLTTYILTLLLFARGMFEHVQTAALWLAVGGGVDPAGRVGVGGVPRPSADAAGPSEEREGLFRC